MERCVGMIGIICLLAPVSGQQGGGVLSCQQTWTTGSNVKLAFFIDWSRLSSLCTNTNNRPFFQRSTDGITNQQINCTVSDITAPGACSGSFQSGTLGCGCTANNAGYYIVEYNFIAHPDYNGWWRAGIQCTDSSQRPILSFSQFDCDNKQAQTASGQVDGVLVCPRRWIIGSVVKLKFILDKDRFPSECNYTDARPVFQMSRNTDTNYQTKCIAEYITSPVACSALFKPGSLGCGCTANDGVYFVLEYNFIANPDNNGWWRASILCQDRLAKDVLSFKTVNCDNKMAQSSASKTGTDANIATLVIGILTFGASNTANDVKIAALVIGMLTFGL